jgi:uncharacterized membrane protein YccC
MSKLPQALKDRQVTAALAVLQGKSKDEIAKVAGVTTRTIGNWRHDTRFQALIEELDRERVEACRRVLRDSVVKAAARLQFLLDEQPGELRAFDLIQLLDRLTRFLPEEPGPEQVQQAALQMIAELEEACAGVPAVGGQDLYEQVHARLIELDQRESNGHALRND